VVLKAGMTLVVPEPKNTAQDISVNQFLMGLGITLDRQKLLDRYDRTEESENSANGVKAPGPDATGEANAQGQPRHAGNDGGGTKLDGGSQRETANDKPDAGTESRAAGRRSHLQVQDLRAAIETANAINSTDELTSATEERLAAHLVRLFAPLKTKIQAIAGMTDLAAQRNALSALKVDVINEIIDAKADPGTERILEKALVTALEEGFRPS